MKTVHMLLRRRHLAPRAGATGSTSGTFLNDEQFEVLESGAVWDEAADEIAAHSSTGHS